MSNFATGISSIDKHFIMPNPEALVSGLLIVNVKHCNIVGEWLFIYNTKQNNIITHVIASTLRLAS